MQIFSLEIGVRKQLLLAFALILSPSLTNAKILNVESNAIPQISSEYFTNLEMKPRFWLSPKSYELDNINEIKINKDLTIKVIGLGVNVPECALTVVQTKDNTIRLDCLEN
jgi:hypothetical protein